MDWTIGEVQVTFSGFGGFRDFNGLIDGRLIFFFVTYLHAFLFCFGSSTCNGWIMRTGDYGEGAQGGGLEG